MCERFHRTMQDEFYSVAFRKRLYSTLEELQGDADAWMREYNGQRPHSGKVLLRENTAADVLGFEASVG